MRSKINRMMANEFFQGSVLLVIANFIIGFLNYLFNSLSAKTLGPAKYGEITTFFAYTLVLSVPMQIISAEIIRRLGAVTTEKSRLVYLWEKWLIEKAKRWFWLIVPYFGLVAVLPKVTNLSYSFSFALLLSLLTSLISVFFMASFQGLRLFNYYVAFMIFGVFIKLLGPVFVYFGAGQLNTIFIFLVLSAVSPLTVICLLFRKIVPVDHNHVPVRKNLRKVIFNRSIIFLGLSLWGISLFNNLDMIYVKKFFPTIDAGLYGAWNLMAKIVGYVLGPVSTVAFIYFSSKENEKKHNRALILIIGLFVLSAVFLFGGYYFFGKIFIDFIFNKSYYPIIPYLPWAAVFGFFYSLVAILNNYSLAKKKHLLLTVMAAVPFYLAGLVLFGKDMQSVVTVDVIFALVVTIAYGGGIILGK
ncbi:hypothetical protein GYA28_01000 [Candidatus Roizmanbacteria bacterium]|nr:hypothetical protein [Candidatus Roizmanbacteria bacterium]